MTDQQPQFDLLMRDDALALECPICSESYGLHQTHYNLNTQAETITITFNCERHPGDMKLTITQHEGITYFSWANEVP